MTLLHKLKWFGLGVVLLCAASGSAALTLGRASGAAIIGRALEVTVPIHMAADEDASALCFEADVFYGDSRLDSNRVTVTSEAATQGLPLKVRVSAYAPVDEPIVTVYLRAACGKQATRRYVLLADLVSELAPVLVARPAPSGVVNGVAADALTSKRSTPTIDAPMAPGKPVIAGKAAAIAKSGPIKSRIPVHDEPLVAKLSAPSKPVRVVVAAASRHPRLKLAPMDLAQELDPTLKISNELMSVPIEDLIKRAEAVALWRSLNATPQEVLRDGARLQAMEGDFKALREITSKNRLEMLDLAARLDRAEAQRYANPLVYGLLALLLACGAGLAYGVFRLRAESLGSAPWWRGPDADDKRSHQSAHGLVSEAPELARSMAEVPTESLVTAARPVTGLHEVDIDLQLADAAFSDLGKPSPAISAVQVAVTPRRGVKPGANQRDFSHSVHSALREISTEEMLDVRQQADFFMTLGQYEEAIDVLETCVNAGGESNPLVYLDLLKVFHTLGRKSDYEHYRNQFNALFSGNVPAYESFSQQGSALDAYSAICVHIEELWPSPDAVEYIEKCLVRGASAGSLEGFDLEAFKDLLLLHGVAKRLGSSTDSRLMPFSTSRSSIPVLAPSADVNSQELPNASIAQTAPHAAAEFSIDFDLSEPDHNLIEFDGVSFLAGAKPPPR